MKLAVFDICGTLYDCNTFFAFCRAQSDWPLTRLILSPPMRALDALTGRPIRRNLLARLACHLPEWELAARAKAFVFGPLAAHVRADVACMLRQRREQGYAAMLLSATPWYIATSVAEFFHADGYRAGFALAGKKHVCLAALSPWDALFVATDNWSDRRLLACADEALVVTKKKHVTRWRTKLCSPSLWVV